MIDTVLDTSALIAFLRKESGADRVAAILSHACISAVNLTEIITKMIDCGKPLEEISHQIGLLQIPVVAFDSELAHIAASLRKSSTQPGLSLGDLACLALAVKMELPVMTTEKEWKQCKVGIEVITIR
jgi:ribonuclease VapC